MPKTAESDESRMIKAYEAARREKNPNITKIAREFGVNRRNLQNRVKKGMQAHTAQKPVNKVLDTAQEEALTRWICQLNNWNMPLKPRLIEA
jgi:transposase-like protein